MIVRGCIRCKRSFSYRGELGIGRGSMTRKYCDDCNVLQHRDESREYMRRIKIQKEV